MAWTRLRGRRAAEEELSVVNVARGYLVWRDVTMEMLVGGGGHAGVAAGGARRGAADRAGQL